MEFELNSMKKSSMQQKAELKHLGTVVINDLKNLKVGPTNPSIPSISRLTDYLQTTRNNQSKESEHPMIAFFRKSQAYIYPWSKESRYIYLSSQFHLITKWIYKMGFRGRMKSLGNNLGSCERSSHISTGFRQRKICANNKIPVSESRKQT